MLSSSYKSARHVSMKVHRIRASHKRPVVVVRIKHLHRQRLPPARRPAIHKPRPALPNPAKLLLHRRNQLRLNRIPIRPQVRRVHRIRIVIVRIRMLNLHHQNPRKLRTDPLLILLVSLLLLNPVVPLQDETAPNNPASNSGPAESSENHQTPSQSGRERSSADNARSDARRTPPAPAPPHSDNIGVPQNFVSSFDSESRICRIYFVSGSGTIGGITSVSSRSQSAAPPGRNMHLHRLASTNSPARDSSAAPRPRSGGSFTVFPSAAMKRLIHIQHRLHGIIAGGHVRERSMRISLNLRNGSRSVLPSGCRTPPPPLASAHPPSGQTPAANSARC